jgi:hypothetical protein
MLSRENQTHGRAIVGHIRLEPPPFVMYGLHESCVGNDRQIRSNAITRALECGSQKLHSHCDLAGGAAGRLSRHHDDASSAKNRSTRGWDEAVMSLSRHPGNRPAVRHTWIFCVYLSEFAAAKRSRTVWHFKMKRVFRLERTSVGKGGRRSTPTPCLEVVRRLLLSVNGAPPKLKRRTKQCEDEAVTFRRPFEMP